VSRLSIELPATSVLTVPISSPKHAHAVTRVLNGHSPSTSERSLFATVVRAYLRIVPEARGAFVAWYEALAE
jgi:hypothetical protein